MNKQAHITLTLCDLFCLWLLWDGSNEFQRILSEISNQVDVIEFGNRVGFFIVGIGIPLIHLVVIVEKLRPAIIKQYTTILNTGIYLMVAVLIISSFAGSSWIKSKVENAGYIYCRLASGVSAVSKVLVYTKDIKKCEDLVEAEKRRPRAKYKK